MRTFEIGKRYRDGAATFEIIGRTAKTVRFVMIQHAGHFNERKGDEKRAKVNNWDGREVFFTNCYQVEAKEGRNYEENEVPEMFKRSARR